MSMMDYNDPNGYWLHSQGYDPYKGLSEEDRERIGCLHGIGYVVVLVIMLVLMAMCQGCTTTRYVEVEKVRTDTVRENHTVRDSIFMRDSIYVHEWQKGETVYVERAVWHTAVQERLRTDTVYRATHDTVPQAYPVPEYIERELTWWQRVRLWLGSVTLCALVVLAGVWLWRVRCRR